MKHLKTFNEEYNVVIKLDDYFSDPNAEECPVLDFLMKYQVEKVTGEIETSDDPWITKNEKENIWELNYEFYITDSDIGKWFKKVTKGKYTGHEYKIELKLPLKEFDILIYLYKSKKIDDSEFIKMIGDLSSKSGEEYGIKLTDFKSTQMNYIRKVNPEALKEIGLYNMKNFELDNTLLSDIEWSSKNETFTMKHLRKFNEGLFGSKEGELYEKPK